MSRESDIKELCRQVKNASVLPEMGDSGEVNCPFCYGGGAWNVDTLDEIDHELTCAYLIAIDLSTE